MGKVKLAARTLVREYDRETAEQLVLSGSFVRVVGHNRPTLKQQKAERRQRRHALARRARGWKPLHVWLPPELRAALRAETRPGETIAQMLERLLAMAGGAASKTRAHGHAGMRYQHDDGGNNGAGEADAENHGGQL